MLTAPEYRSAHPQPAAQVQRAAAWDALRRFSTAQDRQGQALASATQIRLQSTRAIAARRNEIVRAAFDPANRVAGTSLLVPPELIWAAGFLPFNLEMYASLLASGRQISDLTNRGSQPTPSCSFFNALRGAQLEGLLPRPDVLIGSSAYCESIGYVFEELALGFGVPHLHLDIPNYRTPSSAAHLGQRLSETFFALCSLSGFSIREGERRLRKAMRLSAAAKRAYRAACMLRTQHLHLDLALEPLLWHFTFFSHWGTRAGLEVCTGLHDELADMVERDDPSERRARDLPLAVFSLLPYGRTQIWQVLLDAGARSVFEGLNWLGDPSLIDPPCLDHATADTIFLTIAENLIDSPMRGGQIRQQAEEFMTAARTAGARGLIIFSHDQCQMLSPRLNTLERVATEAGLTLCLLDGDCLLGVPMGPASLRLKTFLSHLGGARVTRFPRPVRSGIIRAYSAGYRIGIDFGSWFSKYVILDENDHVMAHGTFNSGIDYPALVDRIKNQVPADRSHELAVAGVGGDHPEVRRLVTGQTTEINALITAIRHLYTGTEPLLVVDIGSQDIKVLRFTTLAAQPWCNTNRACGAGTGCVLTQILERWRQTEPEMSFAKLDELAAQATHAESINTTCGIFAVTHVVSALIQSDTERRRSILRGVYRYIVSQATRHFPSENRSGGPLLAVGGVAHHTSLRLAFEEEGYQLLSLPEGVGPQHVVALGAALSL